jgi:hypothetical protein
MATSKSDSKTKTKAKKVTGKSKAADTAKSPRGRKKSVAEIVPGDDEIRQKAQEIYNDRISRGEAGTPEEDWLKAEKLLRG